MALASSHFRMNSPGKNTQILDFQCAAMVTFQYWISLDKQAIPSRPNVSLVSVVLVQPNFRPFIAWELGNTR
jgi:hypothetical protein